MSLEPRSGADRRRDTEHRLANDVDVRVATASAEGGAYLVPLSFYWDGAALLSATPADSPTGSNLAAQKKVRLGLDDARDVTIIDGDVVVRPRRRRMFHAGMRKRGTGAIVQIGSMGGQLAPAGPALAASARGMTGRMGMLAPVWSPRTEDPRRGATTTRETSAQHTRFRCHSELPAGRPRAGAASPESARWGRSPGLRRTLAMTMRTGPGWPSTGRFVADGPRPRLVRQWPVSVVRLAS